jgi:hypothetical protein
MEKLEDTCMPHQFRTHSMSRCKNSKLFLLGFFSFPWPKEPSITYPTEILNPLDIIYFCTCHFSGKKTKQVEFSWGTEWVTRSWICPKTNGSWSLFWDRTQQKMWLLLSTVYPGIKVCLKSHYRNLSSVFNPNIATQFHVTDILWVSVLGLFFVFFEIGSPL